MKLCTDCRNKLRFLVLYILTLASLIALATGLLFYWNPFLVGGVFLVGAIPGICYIYGGTCRLCRFFHRHGSGEQTRTI